jgi:acetoin utilization deacetylase AcuC-like enzyme
MLQAKHTTGLVFFPAFDWAISPTHPEREERLLYTQDQVIEEGLLDVDGIVEMRPDLATEQDIKRVHFCVPSVDRVVTESHLISAGGAKTVAKAVMEKQVERGFALVRPPGHHAMQVVHGARGFCNINIEAVMVEWIRQAYGVDRVAIVDTDCHHGDGTQNIYWHDPDTLYISIHQDGRTLFPGTGFADELGGPAASGATVNIPLPPHTSEEGFLYAMENVVMPVLEEFKPELIINSAGQDNHYTDPITSMDFCAQGYAKLTEMLKPDIAVLEGGYAIEGALPYVNAGIILAMAGLDYSKVVEPDYEPEEIRQSYQVTAYIKKLCDQVMHYYRQALNVRQRNIETNRFDEQSQTIYYDTDNIVEQQTRRVRMCRDCAGLLTVDSRSDRGRRILGLHIPRKACKECRELGLYEFEAAETRLYHHVLLQDRPQDEYKERKR